MPYQNLFLFSSIRVISKYLHKLNLRPNPINNIYNSYGKMPFLIIYMGHDKRDFTADSNNL